MIFLWPTGSVVVHEAAAKRNRYVRAADYTIGIHKRSDFTGCRSSCWLAINPKTKGKCIVRESVRSDKNLIEIRVLFDVSYKPAHSNLSLSESSHGFFLKIKCNRFKSASRCSRSHSTAVSCLDLFEWQESANWHGSREIKVDHSRHVCVNTNSQTVDTRLFSLGWRDCIIFIGTGSFFSYEPNDCGQIITWLTVSVIHQVFIQIISPCQAKTIAQSVCRVCLSFWKWTSLIFWKITTVK